MLPSGVRADPTDLGLAACLPPPSGPSCLSQVEEVLFHPRLVSAAFVFIVKGHWIGAGASSASA